MARGPSRSGAPASALGAGQPRSVGEFLSVSSVPAIIDVDQHLSEARTAWGDHIDPAFRDDALSIEADALGWSWLTWRGQHLFAVEHQVPRHPEAIGAERLRREA